MKRKLSIIKNGYDVLRIIEMGTGEFKITNETGRKDFDVFAKELFLPPKFINFDKSKRWEISYHASNEDNPTKIHLKNTLEEDDYIDLKLTHLIDPDINTEIPIPLFKILIPDIALKKKYKGDIRGDKNHVVIDVENNNSIEIFLTANNFIKCNYSNKWENMITFLVSNDIRYYASNSTEYIGMNYFYLFHDNDKFKKIVSRSAIITDNIGIMINTINVLDLSASKLTFLFIDNSEYLTFLANSMVLNPKTKQVERLYKLDLNKSLFSYDERQKWNRIFHDKEILTNKIMKKYKKRILAQIERKKKSYNEINEIKHKCGTFLSAINSIKLKKLEEYNLISKKEIEIAKKDLISDVEYDLKKACNIDINKLSNIDWWFINPLFDKQSDVTLLLCKYFGIQEPVIFKYTIKSKNYHKEENNELGIEFVTDQNLKFDYIRLLYNNKYDIELFRGVLNVFLDNKKENKILICNHFRTEKEYMMYGVSERLKLENKFDIQDEEIFRIDKEKFNSKFRENNKFLEEVYNLIIEHIENTKIIYD